MLRQMVRPLVLQAQAAPAGFCPRCGGATQFVAEQQRAFCGACQQYV